MLKGDNLDLIAGCPPCQGFSSIRKLNRKRVINDKRNALIDEFFRFVNELNPSTIMLENVPGLINYTRFKNLLRNLKKLGYQCSYKVVNVAKYAVPQRRRRLVLVGSRLGNIEVSEGLNKLVTVREALKKLDSKDKSDKLQNIYPKHSKRIKKMIAMVPKDGGSRSDLPEKYKLKCHTKTNVGFNDVYGRLKWDAVSSTITGGCLNPSKGRFLHPTKNRCISAREAAILQSFPINYSFPTDIPRVELALLIGNALPPEFCRIQAENISNHIIAT